MRQCCRGGIPGTGPIWNSGRGRLPAPPQSLRGESCMRKALIVLLLLAGTAIASDKNVQDFPVKFFVRSESIISTSLCTMELEAGNMTYWVEQKPNPILFQTCGTFSPRSEVQVRFVSKGNYVELSYICCQDFNHQSVKLKTQKWRVDHSLVTPYQLPKTPATLK